MELHSVMGRNQMAAVTIAQRDEITKHNRALVEKELLAQRLSFESRPYEAHMQFSNFCNMSCIMCWDGENPPMKKMTPELLEKVATQIAPNLAVITPHEASEPTVLTWEDTVKLAREYSIQLMLTTNVQEFDEAKFHEVKDVLETVCLSIDSHIPEVFEKIRLGAKADQVFGNARTIAQLCQENGVECIGQAVFMTENAHMMPETVIWFADMGVQFVSVTQMIDTNRRSWHLDATLHFSAEYLDWIKNKCVAAARDKRVRLAWFLGEYEMFDFREEGAIGPNESKTLNDSWEELMKRKHPGFCRFAYHRLRVEVEGNVSPCGMDSHHELELGNLSDQDFDEIWNGPTARDLRRAHYTWDYPSLCKTCRFVDLAPAREALPFLDEFLLKEWGVGRAALEPTLTLVTPEHMLRNIELPPIVITSPGEATRFFILLSRGGECEDSEILEPQVTLLGNDTIELSIREEVWEGLRPNVGYWWTVVSTVGSDTVPTMRAPEVRCFVKHEPMARIVGSALKYQDEGHFSVIYLGGDREVGWKERGTLPSRPPLKGTGAVNTSRPRFAKLRKAPEVDAKSLKMTPEGYRELVGHVRDVANSALPSDASVLVASKGDAALLDLNGRAAQHFPRNEGGEWAGFHPRDSDWAIGHLERLRAQGGEFLLLPATVCWWFDHYGGFAEHLRSHYAAIVEDGDRCTIFDLRQTLIRSAG